MASNGKLSNKNLAPITGGGYLRKDAARAWNAFAKYIAKRGGHVSVSDSYRPVGKPGDLNRGTWSQWAAWEKYQQGGNLAAQPGTSNHGLGLALDVPPDTQMLIAKYGKDFGWNKSWSDAPSEPWHFKWAVGNYGAVEKWANPMVGEVVKQGDKGPAVVMLKKLLKHHGFWPNHYNVADGGFGYLTSRQVKKFQQAKKLKADGVVGPGTWKALQATPVKPKPAPKPVSKPQPTRRPGAKYFADIYGGDGTFDAQVYKTSGHDLIVLKATEGKTFQDPKYLERVKAARAAGLIVFSYHFARPSKNTPEEEAKNFTSLVKVAGMTTQDRLVLDWEDPNFKAVGDVWIDKFIKAVAKEGLTVRILYSGSWYLPDTLKGWPVDQNKKPLRYWHAAYQAKPEANVLPYAKPHLWAVQYTDAKPSSVGPHIALGIGPCDMNYLV